MPSEGGKERCSAHLAVCLDPGHGSPRHRCESTRHGCAPHRVARQNGRHVDRAQVVGVTHGSELRVERASVRRINRPACFVNHEVVTRDPFVTHPHRIPPVDVHAGAHTHLDSRNPHEGGESAIGEDHRHRAQCLQAQRRVDPVDRFLSGRERVDVAAGSGGKVDVVQRRAALLACPTDHNAARGVSTEHSTSALESPIRARLQAQEAVLRDRHELTALQAR